MKNWIMSCLIVIILCIFCFVIVYFKADFSCFINDDTFSKEDTDGITIYLNDNFKHNNVSERTEEIKYIVIHYTGTRFNVLNIIHSYNNSSRDASADYFIDDNGKIYQYNLDLDNYYSWAVGGDKVSNEGRLYGFVNNNNSISIELSVYVKNNEWLFKDDTLSSAVDLVKYLKDKYSIPNKNVIRHYDVTGKECPNVKGFIGKDDNKWKEFKEKIGDR